MYIPVCDILLLCSLGSGETIMINKVLFLLMLFKCVKTDMLKEG